MKVVLDTNVLIDAFKDDNSYEKRIIDEVIAGRIEAYANRQTMQENKLLLGQVINNSEYEKELNDFFAQLNMVVNRHQIHIVEDREDNKILESAIEAEAEYLITRDNALLTLDKYQGLRIVTPAAFWARYKDDSEEQWKSWASFFGGK